MIVACFVLAICGCQPNTPAPDNSSATTSDSATDKSDVANSEGAVIQGDGYTVRLPKNWKSLPLPTGPVLSHQSHPERMVPLVTNSPPAGMTVEQFADYHVEGWKKKFREEAVETVTIPDSPARIVYKQQISEETGEPTGWSLYATVPLKNKVLSTMTGIELSQFEEFRDEFEKIIKSIEVE